MTIMPSEEARAIDELVSSVRQRLLDRHTNVSGLNIAKLADTMVRSVPPGRDDTSNLAEVTGPFYNTSGLARWLGISRQALNKRAANHRILACKTTEGHLVYPVWQFTSEGEPLPGLTTVLSILAAGIDSPWTWAQWLQGSTPERLDGRTPADWLASASDPAPVYVLARQDAAVWAA